MTPTEYNQLAMNFDLKRLEYCSVVNARLSDVSSLRVLHASLGLTTESAEIADAVKRYMMYGKPLDRTNLIEEAGDVLWYLTLLLDEVGVTLEDAMEANIRKLETRYPDGFTEDRAINRDVRSERDALEGK